MSTKIKKCFKEGEYGGERHKGIRKIPVSDERIKGHLNKAIHNFKAMLNFRKEGFSDWSASASFYFVTFIYNLLLGSLIPINR